MLGAMRSRPAARLALASLLLVPVLSACAEAQSAATKAGDCAGLAADVARTGLDRVPTVAEAEQAVQRLDDRLGSLRDEQVRSAASTLRDRLQELVTAARSGSAADAQQAADAARSAARETAGACGLPVDQFLS